MPSWTPRCGLKMALPKVDCSDAAKTAKKYSHSNSISPSRHRGCTSLFLLLCTFLTFSVSVRGIEMDICKDKSCYPATGNLLIGRDNRLSATSTCGRDRMQRYCIVSHLEDKKKCFFCDSTREWMRNVNERSHRIENIVTDGFELRNKKWWQSSNGVPNVSIRLDLEAEFHFTHLIMTFKTFRPAAMFIERSSDFGKTWKIYRYFAYECQDSYAGIARGPPRNHTDVICTQKYSNVAPSTGGEVVFKVLSPHIPLPDPYAPEIQQLLKITNLRINFTKLHTLGDDLLDYRPEIDEKYYYAIYDMVVRGSCSCYGHASRCIPIQGDGVAFVNYHRPDMVHGRCECTHHTTGLNCEQCEAFFNDIPWRPAIDRETNACKRCNCNNHASRCHFDRAVYEDSGFVSGGVCDDCQHNTMGKNCEVCHQGFYRDVARDVTDPYVCLPCQCDPRGSMNNGICDSTTDKEKNLIAGRCRCKENIDGERCDRCKHGFWDMKEDDAVGCKACTCFLTGTVGNEGCDKYTGECTCKRLVTGENCDQCLENHYGLSEDPEGCKPCDCDIGGSFEEKCDVTSGQCRCRPHFSGRRCDTPESGYFCANIDYYTYEAEEAVLETDAEIELREPAGAGVWNTFTGTGFARGRQGSVVKFDIRNLEKSQQYALIIRYEVAIPSGWEEVSMQIVRPGPASSDSPCYNNSPNDDFLTTYLSPGGRYVEIQPTVCLDRGVPYEIRLTLGQPRRGIDDRAPTILIDSLIVSPPTDTLDIFKGSSLALYHKDEYERHQCRHRVLDLTAPEYRSEVCSRYLCPIAAITMDRGLECDCDPTGSKSGICSHLGGQCECKENVIGRRCDKCAPGTFGFGPQGCSACECDSVGSLDNFCDLQTGQCKCREEGIYGRECNQCQSGFWGFPNCRLCECNNHANVCDQETGFCESCRDLTVGRNCDRCQDGYYGDPRIGVPPEKSKCQPCPCPGGPNSGYQHAPTCYLDPHTENVVCNCRPEYVGAKCDKCTMNHWGIPTEVGGTCEPCECNDNIDMSVPESCGAVSGECKKCLHHTEGFHCEHCVNGYFGDAKMRQCRMCVCEGLGTNTTSVERNKCDRVSGQCPCLPNVTGKTCDACAENHWSIASGVGCKTCDCDTTGVRKFPDGSPILQCNLFDGKCDCKMERGGRDCSECKDYHWGDPTLDNCQLCDCNPTGSSQLQCHRNNGTCLCQPGSGGPKCDQCARGYTGTWPNCQECGECFQNWDTILQDLKVEAKELMEKANSIEDTGVASVYETEFKEMEGQLAEMERQLDTANVSQADVEELRQKMDTLDVNLEEARDRLNKVDLGVVKVVAEVETEGEGLRGLEEEAEEVKEMVKDLQHKATELREGDVEGAYNITLESERRSAQARAKADQTDGIVRESENKRNRAEEELNANERDFNEQYQSNEEELQSLSENITKLEEAMPELNKMMCGAEGGEDGCDDICGGAGCGSCGGPACGDGALTKSEAAEKFATQASEILAEKQKEADELLRKMKEALQETQNAGLAAESAFDTAKRVAGAANTTKTQLLELKDKMDKFLSEEGSTPGEIRVLGEEVMNKTISLTPDQIRELSRQIQERLHSLQNIDSILEETRGNLTLAQNLKQRADIAKNRAEKILNTTQGVLTALQKAEAAQKMAKQAIGEANQDIEATTEDLQVIEGWREKADKAAEEADKLLEEYREELKKVRSGYVEIGGDLKAAEAQADLAKRKAEKAKEKKEELERMYEKAQEELRNKQAGSTEPRERAKKLKERASKLLESSRRYVSDIKENKEKFGGNEVSLDNYKSVLDSLNTRITEASNAIHKQMTEYTYCDET